MLISKMQSFFLAVASILRVIYINNIYINNVLDAKNNSNRRAKLP